MTTQPTWHLSAEELGAYLRSASQRTVRDSSAETHLLACAECRALLATLTDAASTDAAWLRLADDVDRTSRRSWLQLAGAPGLLRTAVATPPLLRAAASAALVLGLVPLLASAIAGEGGLLALLVLAPLTPMAAVTLAYRPAQDPAGEIGLVAPVAGLRLVALRALVVAALALPVVYGSLALVSAVGQPIPASDAVAWLLPGAALAAVTLALGTTRVDPLPVAIGISATWATSAIALGRSGGGIDARSVTALLADPVTQWVALAVAVGAAALVVVRRDEIGYRRSM
ncbi:hypothetical protein [Nocardioides daeguensis]|uniref:Zf-HC2 domain-containing protein n=1 Tax=Nocardioides daeguensis TaxID=908359 RepID=A0ABP6USB6_9ACTN|nr:hypothetical protein [Nocardioides daeguensis]MBV6728649.1 hypothetical protein [Nocardioides daeguensis]MCR1773742.1 hypothetical protein [Nocardioides daeguensis]